MSETQTETPARESRAARAARLAAEQASQQDTEQGTETWPLSVTSEAELIQRVALLTPEELAETMASLSDEDRAKIEALPADKLAEATEVAAIGGFAVTESPDLRQATTPVRHRKAVQQAMDAVARKAYTDWVEAGRPTTWSRMPVITYFLDPDQVTEYRKLIRSAVQIVPVETYEKDGKTIEPTGVRARFGGDFVLGEKMAAKIGKPGQAGKTVLAWAAVDKRHVSTRNGEDD
jgi:hypothetical protein